MQNSAEGTENRPEETNVQQESNSQEEENHQNGERGMCTNPRPLEGQSVLSVVLDIQRRSVEQQLQSSRASFDIHTRVLGSTTSTTLQPEATSDRAMATASSRVSSLEVNLSDTVLARSITLENDETRAEARIELVGSSLYPQAPPSYTTLPREESSFNHPPPPPSYEQTFGIRYLDREIPFIAINNTANHLWGYRSQPAFCARCNAMVLTNTDTEFCFVTYLTLTISFVSFCWPCMAIPIVLPAFKEVHHFCPACNQLLGCYHPISRNRSRNTVHSPQRRL